MPSYEPPTIWISTIPSKRPGDWVLVQFEKSRPRDVILSRENGEESCFGILRRVYLSAGEGIRVTCLASLGMTPGLNLDKARRLL